MTSSTPGPTRRPARPSAAVYRRRRAVALLVLLLVVAGVAWGVSALLGGRDSVPEAAAAEVAPPPAEPSPGHVAVCSAEDLTADVAVEPTGSGARVEVSVRNSGEVPCLVEAGPGTLVAEVVSGTDPVWSSRHCAGEASEELLLDAGTTTPVTVDWDGHRSAEGCPGDQPQAGPGTYRVTVALDGEALGTAEVFTLG